MLVLLLDSPGNDLAGTGSGDLGSSGRAAALYLFEDLMAWVAFDRAVLAGRAT